MYNANKIYLKKLIVRNYIFLLVNKGNFTDDKVLYHQLY